MYVALDGNVLCLSSCLQFIAETSRHPEWMKARVSGETLILVCGHAFMLLNHLKLEVY